MLTFAVLIALARSASFDAFQELEPTWSDLSHGAVMGKYGLAAGISAGGRARILSSADDAAWVSSTWNQATATFRADYSSPLRDAPLRDLALGDLDGDGQLEVLALYEDGVMTWTGFDSLVQHTTLTTSISDPVQIEFVDPDPHTAGQELLILGSAEMVRLSAQGQVLASYGRGGEEFVCGQLDGDASFEIAISSGAVFDLNSGALEWDYPAGFGVSMTALDTDQDGIEEIVATDANTKIDGFDLVAQSQEWTYSDTGCGIVRGGDFDGDGVEELLVGSRNSRNIEALIPETRALRWELPNSLSGIAEFASVDMDQDGEPELIYCAGVTSTDLDRVVVQDPNTGTREWTSKAIEGPFLGPLEADLDGDGLLEIVIASSTSKSFSGSGRIAIYDAVTLELLERQPSTQTSREIHAMSLADPDGDGFPQIFTAVNRGNEGLIQEWFWARATGFQLGFESEQPAGETFLSMEVVDLEGDGDWEIVVGGAHESTAANGAAVHAYAYPVGIGIWRSATLSSPFRRIGCLKTIDLDHDGVREIVAGVLGGDLYVLDHQGNVIDQETADCTSMDILSSGPLQGQAVVVGDFNGRITVYRGAGVQLEQVFRRQFAQSSIVGVDTSSSSLVFVGADERVRAFRASDLVFVGETARYGGVMGRNMLASRLGGWLLCDQLGLRLYQR
ncbi:MAG: hypothetical protein CMJ94_15310 [Planctomycetes bacterium]|nr:hypothetical protein [Planctomycetota bacterium]